MGISIPEQIGASHRGLLELFCCCLVLAENSKSATWVDGLFRSVSCSLLSTINP